MRAHARLIAAIACALVNAPALAAQVSGPTQKLRVAVADLAGSALRMQTATTTQPGVYADGSQTTVTVAIPAPTEFARGLTEMLTSVLMATNRFVVLERAAMLQLDQELVLAQGRTTGETSVQQGALLGARAIITGDITGFTFNRSTLGGRASNLVKGLGVAADRVTAEVTIDLRLVDANTGQVIASTKGTGKASQTGVAADLVEGEKSFSSDASATTPLGTASRQALDDAVSGLLQSMPAIRWSARVVDVRDGIVYLGAVGSDGVKPGLELDVYAIGEPLIDPATGESLGSPERLLGAVRVETVLEKFSTARVLSGEGIARGHVVRMKGTTP